MTPIALRSLPDDFDTSVVAEIDARLSRVEQEHAVAIPLAIESGSRAWGFPSPDSDYDCRFVFVRPVDQHLTLWQHRDVIETPLEGLLDVNGWDLGKALKLMLRGNAVILEWLTSPIAYCGESQFRDEFLALASEIADRRLIGRHYLRFGERQRDTFLSDEGAVQQKKIFYALRPAAALRWLRFNPEKSTPPMHFPTLIRECDPPADLSTVVDELLARKAVTRELGVDSLSPEISDFIRAELALAAEAFDNQRLEIDEGARLKAETFLLRTIRRLEGLRFA